MNHKRKPTHRNGSSNVPKRQRKGYTTPPRGPQPPRRPPPSGRVGRGLQRRPRRRPPREPFGFDISRHIEVITPPSELPSVVYQINNYITGFAVDGTPIYQRPDKKWTMERINGLYVYFEGVEKPIYISGMHTPHTISLYKMAHQIRTALRQQSPVALLEENCYKFKEVDIRGALRQKRHQDTNVMWLNAEHQGQKVVLKTTTSPSMQLTYIIEAIIHRLVSEKATKYLPRLHFVGFQGDSLIVCSEQLQISSVSTFVGTLPRVRQNPNILVWHMVHAACSAIDEVQRQADFTHRDCHISNVYYDARRNIVKFIDFDWSCVKSGEKIISVPRFLYDTTRPQYGHNRSVDCIVFLRTLGLALKNCTVFRTRIFDPIMTRYELESKIFLKQQFASNDTAALQLYKMSTSNGKISGKYAHKHGIARFKTNFEYHMGYYTWECMTPTSILDFLNKNKFF